MSTCCGKRCIRYPCLTRVGTGRCVYLRPRLEEEALASQLPGAVISSGSPLFSPAGLGRNHLPDFSSLAAIVLSRWAIPGQKSLALARVCVPRKIYIGIHQRAHTQIVRVPRTDARSWINYRGGETDSRSNTRFRVSRLGEPLLLTFDASSIQGRLQAGCWINSRISCFPRWSKGFFLKF